LEAARTLRISPGKLRPDDRFDKELTYSLKIFPFTDLNDDFYAALVARLRAKNISADEAKKWKTLGEYIVALAATQPG
jgi:hypothetical protein